MCGLAFLYASDLLQAQVEERMRLAVRAIAHRGPDAEGLRSGPGWAAGHRRLSIVDLAGSPQPMSSACGRWTLVFNGELYNWRDLRAELAGEWEFRTHGDTEVMLAGLVRHGPAWLAEVEGMFAFALWDGQACSVLAGRDRFGKKPLFFRADAEGFACASELGALRALDARPWSGDADSLADYLRYGTTLPGYSAWKEIRELRPASVLHWKVGGEAREERWWQLVAAEFQGRPEEAAEELRSLLRKAVGCRMVADVEVGAFLSGGVDSSLIVALASGVHDRPLQTFTIGFAEPGYDERQYARQVAERYATRHHEEVLEGFRREELDQLLRRHVGQPFHDSSLLPTALVSRLAARHLKVALSGDGGDELFCGYQRYQARALLRGYLAMPARLRRGGESLLRLLPEPRVHHSRSLLKKAHMFADVAARMADETPYIGARLLREDEIARLAPELAGRGHRPPELPACGDLDEIKRMMLMDTLVYLPQDILTKVDRASMAHGLEARAPFLDSRVAQLAFSLPRSWHRRGMTGKRMLRMAFRELLPESIWRRRKQGFAVPVHAWMRGDCGDQLAELASNGGCAPLAPSEVLSLLRQHREGRRDLGHKLWALHAFALFAASGDLAA